jgi:hypothetical protein
MVSKRLMGVWLALDGLLLISGLISIIFSQAWRVPNVLMNMVLSAADMTAGTVLGVALITTFLVSVVAIAQRNHRTVGLVILNYALLLDAMGIIVIGTFVWWYTLQERANYHQLWLQASSTTRITLQDKFQCCGYFNGSDLAEIGGEFCVSQVFVDSLAAADLSRFCVTPITSFADSTLNAIFTTVYGFMAIVVCLLLATLCVIRKRQEDERFNKIDAKRGGQGFV